LSTAPARGAAAALIIDADNISDAAAIERALAHMQEQGWRLTVRRAYGGHEKLAGLKDCLLRHGIRALVNQGKGTTDALLCVDVMDLFHTAELPDIVAIASSDADFAPLAVRLREAGIRTICFAQAGKSAGEELAKVYEQVVYLDVAAPPAPRPASPAARPARKAPAKKAEKPKPAEPRDAVREMMESMAGFREGRSLELNEVAEMLKGAELLGRKASVSAFLKKNAPWAELLPAGKPNKVRLKTAGR
jgi:hypothetical protein